jgi:hypothetical protein
LLLINGAKVRLAHSNGADGSLRLFLLIKKTSGLQKVHAGM